MISSITGRVALAACVALGVLPLVSPIARSQGWEVAAGAYKAIDGYMKDRREKQFQEEMLARLAEIKGLVQQANDRLAQIQRTLVAMGDYLESEFDATYVSRVQTTIEVIDQELEKYSSKPRGNRAEIALRLSDLRAAVNALHRRPPEGYEWVAMGMIFEDSLARLLPKGAVSRPELFWSHSKYFSETAQSVQELVTGLDEDIAQIEKYHEDLTQPILQFHKTIIEGDKDCDVREFKVYRVIAGSLKEGYMFNGQTKKRRSKCITVHARDGKPRDIYYSMGVSGIGSDKIEESEVAVPKRLTLNQLQASHGDWKARTERRATLQSMVRDCESYEKIAAELADMD